MVAGHPFVNFDDAGWHPDHQTGAWGLLRVIVDFADRLHTSVHWTHVPSLCWWHPPRKGWKLLDQGLILAAHHRGWEWFPKSDHYSVCRSICQLGRTWTIPGLDHLIHTRIVVCQTGFDGLRCRTPHLGPVVRVMWSFSHPPPHKCQTEPSTPPTRSSGTFGMQTAQTGSSYLPTGSRLTGLLTQRSNNFDKYDRLEIGR